MEYRVEYQPEYQAEFQEEDPRYKDVPPPVRRCRQDEMDELLSGLPVGRAVDIDRAVDAVKHYVYRWRKKSGEGSFMIRQLRPGWSRVWRVA